MNDKDEELKKVIMDLEEERRDLEDANTELCKILRQSNDEIEEAHKELITIKMNDKEEELKKVIMDLEEERRDLEDANTELCKKLCESNDEIREAREELISGLRDLSDESSTIRVKQMGRVDGKAFLKVCEERFSGQDVALQHARLFSKWQARVMDSRWEPFKIQRSGDKIVGVVDEEDERLKKLSIKWGDDVKKAVKTALEELYEFNGSGRYPVSVLWNFHHGRKATIKEGIIAHMKHQIKNIKRKRT